MAAIFILLTLNFLGLTSLSHAADCFVEGCQCTEMEDTSYHLVCYGSAITPADLQMTSTISAKVTSLSLLCDPSRRQSSLSTDLFGGFTSLESLSLSQCNISVTSPLVLNSLRMLTISQCILPSLDPNLLQEFTRLENLTIAESGLTRLPRISNLSSLRFLNLSSNLLTTLEPDTLSGPAHPDPDTPALSGPAHPDPDTPALSGPAHPNLTYIDLSYNQITEFPVALLRSAPQLQQLLLRRTSIKELSVPHDLDLRNLTVLDLSENQLGKVLLSRLFNSSRLEELRLCGAGIAVDLQGLSLLRDLVELTLTFMGITDEIWEELNSETLGRLYLTGNALTTVKAARLRSVRVMQLGENNITTLEKGTFQNLSRLTFLNVSRNSIGSLPEMLFPANNSLIALDISSNLLRTVDEGALKGLVKLLYLDLSNNLLEMLPSKVFSDLLGLQFLYLQGNKLTSVPMMSAMMNLIILNVSYNELISLTDVDLQGLAKLQILHANNNRLQFVPPYFAINSPILASLWLQNNLISEVGTMGQHPSLYELRLDNNSLTDFNRGSPFIDMKNLNYLFLDSNQLESIRPHWFPPTIQALSIGRNNFLQFYSTSFINLPQLKSVDLSNNLGNNALFIPSYAVNTFRNNNPKPTFDMSNNIFFCTCDMAYLKVIADDGYRTIVFNTNYPQFIHLKFSYCYTVYEREQLRPFNEVPLSDFTCKYTERFCDIFCNCCSQSECDCALTCPEYCSCYEAGSGFAKRYFHIHCENRNLTAVPDGIPPRATSVYLDGNLLDTVRYTDVNHLRNTETLRLNGSCVSSIEDLAFNNMSSLIHLHLDNNMLTQITDETFGSLKNLTHLYLHNNRITSITYDAFSGLMSLETLSLHGNRLLFLDLKRGATLVAVTLSGNPWLCPCSNMSSGVISVIRNVFSDAVQDGSRLACCLPELVAPGYVLTNNSEHQKQSDDLDIYFPNQTCFYLSSFESGVDCRSDIAWLPSTDSSVASTPAHVVALIVTAVCLLAVVTLVVVGLIKRRELQAWTFVKLGVRVYDQKAKYDKMDVGTKQFDAFVSYSSMDTEFVARTLVPGLEDRRYRLCVHYRDFPVGRNITDTILRAIEESSRTILVLSTNFLHSEWCRFEFQTAHYHILREGTHRLIIVLLGEIPEEALDPDLKVQMKSKTYLKFNDPWFWEKLYFSLPNPRQPNPGGDDPLRGMKILAGEPGDVIHAYEEKQKQFEETEEN